MGATKTKPVTLILRTWKDSQGKDVAQIRQSPRGLQYFCLFYYLPSPLSQIQSVRDVRHIRLSTLKDSIKWIVEIYEKSQTEFYPLPSSWLEELLDFVYAELNSRLNKTLKEGE